jgi:hypothetical protein
VIVDADLAQLYGVPTKVLNQAVKRNIDRFPADFMFRLSAAERRKVVTNCDHLQGLKFSPQLPYAFTEHGAIMAATILNSPQAVNASLFVVRAFVRLREFISTNRRLAAKLNKLEETLAEHDERFTLVFDAIRRLMDEPDEVESPKPPAGYQTELGGGKQLSGTARQS